MVSPFWASLPGIPPNLPIAVYREGNSLSNMTARHKGSELLRQREEIVILYYRTMAMILHVYYTLVQLTYTGLL